MVNIIGQEFRRVHLRSFWIQRFQCSTKTVRRATSATWSYPFSSIRSSTRHDPSPRVLHTDQDTIKRSRPREVCRSGSLQISGDFYSCRCITSYSCCEKRNRNTMPNLVSAMRSEKVTRKLGSSTGWTDNYCGDHEMQVILVWFYSVLLLLCVGARHDQQRQFCHVPARSPGPRKFRCSDALFLSKRSTGILHQFRVRGKRKRLDTLSCQHHRFYDILNQGALEKAGVEAVLG